MLVFFPFCISCAKDAPLNMDALENTEELKEVKSISSIKENLADTIEIFNTSNAETPINISPASTEYKVVTPLINSKLILSSKNESKLNLSETSKTANKIATSTESKVVGYLETKEISKEKGVILYDTVNKSTPSENSKTYIPKVPTEDASLQGKSLTKNVSPRDIENPSLKNIENKKVKTKAVNTSKVEKNDLANSLNKNIRTPETTDIEETRSIPKEKNEVIDKPRVKPTKSKTESKVYSGSPKQNSVKTKEVAIDTVTYIKSGVANQIKLRFLKKQDSYTPGVKHTFLVQVENVGKSIESLDLGITLPSSWDIISQSPLSSLKSNERKLLLVTFYIPKTYEAGFADFSVTVKDTSGEILGSDKIQLAIEENLKLEVHYTYVPENIEAGNLIEATYEIKNTGNTAQEISLSSKNTVKGKRSMTIGPNEIKTVTVTQTTDKRVYRLSYASTNLEVKSANTGDVYRAFTNTQIFPSKIEKRDPFMRFPIQASLLYNSFTSQKYHYSTLSAELRGDGYLDMAKKHHLNFVFRGPKKLDLKRFGVADQYSLIYNYDDKTVVHLGDHGYTFDRLGFNATYGLGVRIDQRVDKWTLSAMYTKPRIYTFNNEPVYGVKAQYHITDSLNAGVSVTRSKGNSRDIYFSIPGNERKEGQITVFNMNYRGKNTYINAESSFSSAINKIDFANFISGGLQLKNLSYAGSLTIGGSDYLGAMRNNFQFSNGLSFYKNRWSLSLGQNLSRINTSLDPIFYSIEPYYENYFASTAYSFNRNHNIRFRIDKRIREDKMKPSSFFYKEYGFEYNYSFSSNRFNFTFNGRIAQTKNMFAQELGYRKNYFNTINVNYRMYRFLTLRGSLNHNYTTRYGLTGDYSNNYRYSLGFNARINRDVRFTANYTSGFSPEDTYLQRDYINASLSARVRRRHLFALRGNYYQNPGVVNNKQFLAYGKYTYSFGIPIKRIIEQGGLQGRFYSTGNGINFKGIRIISAGSTLSVKSNGVFEINNLPLGRNYVIVEESSLPKGVVSTVKMPIEIDIKKGDLTEIDIPLSRSGKISGRLIWGGKNDLQNPNLSAYIKLSNEDFTYSLQSEKDGTFKFQDIVPGNYELSIIRFNITDVYDKVKKISVQVEAAKNQEVAMQVGPKERKIRFNNKNFKVSN